VVVDFIDKAKAKAWTGLLLLFICEQQKVFPEKYESNKQFHISL
jgi:hypothetical protein